MAELRLTTELGLLVEIEIIYRAGVSRWGGRTKTADRAKITQNMQAEFKDYKYTLLQQNLESPCQFHASCLYNAS